MTKLSHNSKRQISYIGCFLTQIYATKRHHVMAQLTVLTQNGDYSWSCGIHVELVAVTVQIRGIASNCTIATWLLGQSGTIG